MPDHTRETERMKVFIHQVYECRKGVRGMALCSLPEQCRAGAIRKLEMNGMAWFIAPLKDGRFNIFFGDADCVRLAEKICHKPLNDLTAEEDFILGTLLGYGVREQCRRFFSRSGNPDGSIRPSEGIRVEGTAPLSGGDNEKSLIILGQFEPAIP